MRKLMACLVALVATTGGSVSASVLYSQPFNSGNPQGFSSQNDTNLGGFGNFATAYDNFRLTTSSLVNNVQWTGVYFNPAAAAPINGFTLQFLANNAGTPGAVLYTANISGNANETSLGNFGGFPYFTYSANLSTPFTALAGQTYWVSVVPNIGFPPQWGWAAGTGGDGAAYQTFFGTGAPIGSDLAFQLNGSAVPEPISLVVFGGLLVGGAGIALRRRMTKAAA